MSIRRARGRSLRPQLAQAATLLAINPLLYAQTDQCWAAFDDASADALNPPSQELFDDPVQAMVTALSELRRGGAVDDADVELIRSIPVRAGTITRSPVDVLVEGESTGSEFFEPAVILTSSAGS